MARTSTLAVATVTHLTRCTDDGVVVALHRTQHGWLCASCEEVTDWLALDPREWICATCMGDRNWSTPVAV